MISHADTCTVTAIAASMSDAKCPELSDLIEELFEVKIKWYYIGVHLKIPEDKLDEIESTCKDDFERALRLLMQTWRKRTEPKATWADLVRALRKRTVNEQDLAATLEERYVAPTSTSDAVDSPDSASSTSQELSIVPRPTAQAACKFTLHIYDIFTPSFRQ